MSLKVIIVLISMTYVFCAPTEKAIIQEAEPQHNLSRGSSLFGCGSSQYACSSVLNIPVLKPKCIELNQICNGVKDCPAGDDEQNDFCIPPEVREQLKEAAQKGVQNDFAGTGFMFSVGNLIVSGGSRVKMFNQDSDNINFPSNSKQ
jgi:hypothetical protein